MTDELEPIDSELADLLSVERGPDVIPQGAELRVKSAVLHSVAILPPSGGNSGDSGSNGVSNPAVASTAVKVAGAGKALVASVGVAGLVLGTMLGVGLERNVLNPERFVEQEVVLPAAPVPSSEPRVVIDPSSVVVSDPAEADVPAVGARISRRTAVEALPTEVPAPIVETLADTRDAERALLAEAQGELRSGRGLEALLVLRRYEQQFSNPHFAEERDALEVRALLRSGERALARERAQRFLERYPRSLFAPSVRTALSDVTP